MIKVIVKGCSNLAYRMYLRIENKVRSNSIEEFVKQLIEIEK
jgi:hypothetical protein